jgi:hypothetical protein
MSAHSLLPTALLAVAVAMLPVASFANDDCRQPCRYYLPQKGAVDPTAYGCGDLIENLGGFCRVSAWDDPGPQDVRITVHATPRLEVPMRRHQSYWMID